MFIPGRRTGLTQARQYRMENKKNPGTTSAPKKPSSHCFIPGCNTGHGRTKMKNRKYGIKNPSLFSAPRDNEIFKIWQRVIPRADKLFCRTDKVCRLHFTKDDVVTHFECLLPDGHLFQMERARTTIKPNAIPTIFPNLPEYSSSLRKTVDQMRKKQCLFTTLEDFKAHENLQVYSVKPTRYEEMSTPNAERAGEESSKECVNSKTDKANRAVDISAVCHEGLNILENDTNTSDQKLNIGTDDISPIDKNAVEEYLNEPEVITFNMLIRNIETIAKPNNLWSVTEHGKFVMCAKWNENYLPEKRVVIDSNLNIKVYLKDKEVTTYSDMCLNEISDVSTILYLIDS